jgi:hypothetical protein
MFRLDSAGRVRHLPAIDRLGNRADQPSADGPATVAARVKRMP